MSKATNRTTWLRSLAAATLAFWFAAQMLCASHCASLKTTKNCCHKEDKPSSKGTCLVFKIALPTFEAAALVSLEQWQLLVELVLVDLYFVPTLKPSIDDRQGDCPYALIAHEVSLGKAARSLAPPLFS